MYEITFEDKAYLDRCRGDRAAGSIGYPDAEYDFTFDGRFIIYHAAVGEKICYFASDKKTRRASVVKETKAPMEKERYGDMVYDILLAIRYTGDKRWLRYQGGEKKKP